MQIDHSIGENVSGKRLNKYIADSGYCSRREADRLIEEGKVQVDGRTGVLGDRVLPTTKVVIGGKVLTGISRKVYIAMHKPVGIVCTADTREPFNIVDYLHYPQRVFPVGRLDKNSSGLILLTSDGDIVNKILRAAGKHEKEYIVTVDKTITNDFLHHMRDGVYLTALSRRTLPCKIRQTGPKEFHIVLVQGLNRQIRRMCDELGYSVRSLKRIRIMNILLGNLEPGQWRKLTSTELDNLTAAVTVTESVSASEVTDEEE